MRSMGHNKQKRKRKEKETKEKKIIKKKRTKKKTKKDWGSIRIDGLYFKMGLEKLLKSID